ncbi:uncharacterized protein LOC103313582 isoform X2 [Tribolium castaneum]|uniref:uncharacterized protein LOC103313582 isoform X2 n=1 Tax=Tribolium castaneum TaxID=7070 RepID=UPI00077DC268|nr:PREDICTED: uncharacterized protein LOC103313582 isoform X2 [Tribolium castaneum]|eukprot:XP_015836825.1 PREDICTED: uncharacterized protein LOC103313582 isoform X2 [Tribolium castaneum]
MEKTINSGEVEPAKKRRSSILKPRKSRNPLEEIPVSETSPKLTATKPVRRVSFASSNFIKPFVADGEHNTIWDNTIEEDVNHTNSTQSSQDQISSSSSRMDLTNSKKIASLLNTTVLDESMMEFTCHDVAKKIENNIISTSNNDDDVFLQEVEMDLTGVSDSDEKNDNPQSKTNEQSAVDMEFTCQIPTNSKLSNTVAMETMEFTCQQSDLCQISTIPERNGVKTMNCTSQITATEEVDKENIVNARYSEVPLVNCEMPPLSNTMELTCQVPELSIPKIKCQTINIENVDVIDKENMVNVQHTQVPVVDCGTPHLSKINVSSNNDAETMEFTCQIPKLPKIDNESTESPCQISEIPATNDHQTMNFTCQTPDTTQVVKEKRVKLRYSEVPIVNCASPQFKINKLSETVSRNMKYSCQISTTPDGKAKDSQTPEIPKMSNNGSGKLSMIDTEAMEISYQMPDKSMSYKSQIPFFESSNVADKENMREISNVMPKLSKIDNKATESLCDIDKENSFNLRHSEFSVANCENPPKNEIIEYSCQIPTTPDVKCPTQKTETFKESDKENIVNMRHSQIPIIDCGLQVSNVNKLSNNDSATMEFTCEMPKSIVGNKTKQPLRPISAISEMNSTSEKFIPENTVKVRHSEVVNCEMPELSNTDTQTMEFTCQIPKLSIGGNKSKQPLRQISAMSEMNSTSQKVVPENTAKARHSEVVNCEMPQLSNTDTQTMEFTCQMPKLSLVGNKSKQLLRPISAISEMNYTSEKVVSENTMSHSEVVSCEIPELSNTDIQAMEFTCQIPKLVLPGNKATKSSAPPEMTNIKARDEHTLSSVNNQIPEATPVKEINCQNSTISLQKPQIRGDDCFVKTPDPSLHINLMNFTEDDTQQLINHVLVEANHCSFTTTHLENSMGLDDASLLDVQKNRLMNINDTYCLKNKMALKYEEEDSLGILPDECLSEIKDSKPEAKKYDFDKFRKPKPKKELVIKEYPNLAQIIETVRKQRGFIKKYLEDFKCREIEVVDLLKKRPPVESPAKEEKVKPSPTVEETVRKYEESSQKCWKLESIADDFYHISTLFKWVVLSVRLDVVSGVVQSIEFSPKLDPDSKPIDQFISKYFIEKLKDDHLISALGRNYDILSLLDYVKMTVLEIRNFRLDYCSINCMVFGPDFVAIYKIMEIELELLVDVRVDMNDVDNIDYDKHVTIINKIGGVNRQELLNFAKDCPKGLAFFKSFSECIGKYVKAKEQRKGISR